MFRGKKIKNVPFSSRLHFLKELKDIVGYYYTVLLLVLFPVLLVEPSSPPEGISIFSHDEEIHSTNHFF